MSNDEYIKAIAALLAWREEAVNGINGQCAVLFVVRNRVKDGGFGNGWERVIENHNQFSSMSVLGDGQTIKYPDSRDPNFQKVLQLIDGIYDDTVPDNLTDGSLYYADLNSPGFNKTGWFARTILANPEKYPRRAVVGSTTYFGVVK